MLELINAKSNQKKNNSYGGPKAIITCTHKLTNREVLFCSNQRDFFFFPLNGIRTHNLSMIFQLQTVNERLEIYLIYIDKDGNAEEWKWRMELERGRGQKWKVVLRLACACTRRFAQLLCVCVCVRFLFFFKFVCVGLDD